MGTTAECDDIVVANVMSIVGGPLVAECQPGVSRHGQGNARGHIYNTSHQDNTSPIIKYLIIWQLISKHFF